MSLVLREEVAPGATLGRPLGRPRWGIVIAGYLLAVAAGLGYGAVLRAGDVWNAGAPWERELLVALDYPRPGWVETIYYLLPWGGTNLTLGPLIALLAAWLVRRRRRDLAVWVVTVELGVVSLNWLVKHLVVRPRPDLIERVGWYGWASYPSGHAMASLAVLTTLAALAHRATGREWPLWVASALFAVISYTRLLHGVHWPTDVVGGTIVGVIWLVATYAAFVRLPDRESPRPA